MGACRSGFCLQFAGAGSISASNSPIVSREWAPPDPLFFIAPLNCGGRADRQEIAAGAELLGVDTLEHIQFVIDSLKPKAAELGIQGRI